MYIEIWLLALMAIVALTPIAIALPYLRTLRREYWQIQDWYKDAIRESEARDAALDDLTTDLQRVKERFLWIEITSVPTSLPSVKSCVWFYDEDRDRVYYGTYEGGCWPSQQFHSVDGKFFVGSVTHYSYAPDFSKKELCNE